LAAVQLLAGGVVIEFAGDIYQSERFLRSLTVAVP
jgi:hypothetical protein